MGCQRTITAKIQTDTCIKLQPETKIGSVNCRCVGSPQLTGCNNRSKNPQNRNYIVTQMFCVSFPLCICANKKPKTPNRRYIPPLLRCLLALSFGMRV
ncbi:MAG: hypothetical protein PHW34_11495 [Hespellia sp.]|nr:hypothetical protein [Hespellia sp.]